MILWRDLPSLSALVLVPALVAFFFWARRRRARALDAFVAAALLPAVAPELDARRRTTRAILLLGVTLCLAIALAGPMWGFHWQEVRREGIDLVVAIDTSRSMLATDVRPNRLARAKLAVQDLLRELRGDRVGLVAFAGNAFVQCPLTLDYGAFSQSLEAIEVGIIPQGGTALGTAIDTSLAAFEGRQGKHQALVLITDGEDNEGKVKDAAKRAAERGVKLYAVGIGTTEGELIPLEAGGFLKDRGGQVVKSRLGEETLRETAVDTGGAYLHAEGPSLGLTELYRNHIDTMEKRELASTLERRFEHRFQIPLAIALLLLVVEPWIGERRRARRRAWFAWRRTLAVVLLAACSLGWLDRHARAREGNELFAAGKFDEAAAKYNEALIDEPDSALLHLNLGDATYKQGKYDDALKAFAEVPSDDRDPDRAARVAYNVGNTKYRLGAAAETSDPKAALALYAEALIAYRRAMGAAPADLDAKFNHEFVERKIAELQRKLEEQQKQQEQQEQQEQQPEEQQEKPPGEEGADSEQAKSGEQPEPQPSDQQKQQEQQQQAGAGEQPPDTKAGAMNPKEAAALLDAERDQEVQPEEMTKRLTGAAIAEPAKDW